MAEAAVPCVACQSLSLDPSQVSLLPERASGTRTLLAASRRGRPPASGRPVIEALRRRGAVPGLHLTGIPAEDEPLLAAGVDTFLVEVAAGDADRQAFDLKRALSLVRGRRPSATLVIAASSACRRRCASAAWTRMPTVSFLSPDRSAAPANS